MSIFKWEYRKGWDILLKAYWAAFHVNDPVVLRLRTYVPSSEKSTRNITLLIESYALRILGRPLTELPRVVWERGYAEIKSNDVDDIHDSLSRLKTESDSKLRDIDRMQDQALNYMEMRDLIASADAFVLPTRLQRARFIIFLYL